MSVSLRTALPVLCLIVLLQHGESRGQDASGVTIENAGSYGGGNALHVTRGWEFTVERTTAVTSLGMWDEVVVANENAVRVSEDSMRRAGKPVEEMTVSPLANRYASSGPSVLPNNPASAE